MKALALDPCEWHDDFLKSAATVEPHLRRAEVDSAAPGEGATFGRTTKAPDINLEEAVRDRVVLSERQVPRCLPDARSKVLVDEGAVSVVGGDEDATP